MKSIREIFWIFLTAITISSCTSSTHLLEGTWEYVNENGKTSTLIVKGKTWSSEYCYLRYGTDQLYDCFPVEGKVKLIRNKTIKVTLGNSRPHETLVYHLISLDEQKFVLEKGGLNAPYQDTYHKISDH